MIATQNRAVAQSDIVRAFLEYKKKRLGTGTRMAIGGGTGGHGTRYATDGKTLWVWGNLVAKHSSPNRGAVYITDAGWLTTLTKNVLNEILTQLGVNQRLSSAGRGRWAMWDWETKATKAWTGSAFVKDGKVRMYPEAARPSIVFSGYTRRAGYRRSRYVPPPPPPPPPRKFLFNQKAKPYRVEKIDAETTRIIGRGKEMEPLYKKLRSSGLRVSYSGTSPKGFGRSYIIAYHRIDKVKQAIGGYKMLFNPKVRLNLHLPVERAQASKLFRRVYGIAYRAIQQRRWNTAAVKYGVMWGLWHAAAIERPPLTRLIRSWYTAIKEIERVAKAAGAPDFWTARK